MQATKKSNVTEEFKVNLEGSNIFECLNIKDTEMKELQSTIKDCCRLNANKATKVQAFLDKTKNNEKYQAMIAWLILN